MVSGMPARKSCMGLLKNGDSGAQALYENLWEHDMGFCILKKSPNGISIVS